MPSIDPARTPALLLRADYNGTLAASRCLAGHGVGVTMATDSILAFTRWSNSVTRVVPCPSFSKGPGALAQWLIEYGRDHEKAVLYPTCDELAWLVAHYRDQFSEYFHLYSPGSDTLDTLLDKRRLYAAAAAAGIATPRTWYPREEAELAAIMAEAPDVIVKARSQTFYVWHAKGERATRLPQLQRIWNKYRAARFAPEVVDCLSDVSLPMVQEYLPQAATRVVSISGFADIAGRIIASRASCKVLQFPRHAGVGVCFESVEPDPQLQQLLSSLCARSGYHGVFEAEFVEHSGRQLLIDFNPRYFGQMGFDIARGMLLPWLAHLSATGREDEARQCEQRRRPVYREHYSDGLALRWHLAFGWLLGVVTGNERRRWMQWLAATPDRYFDAIASHDDKGPAIASVLGRLWNTLEHPRAYLRSLRNYAAMAAVLPGEISRDYLAILV